MKKIFFLLSVVLVFTGCSSYDYYSVSNKPVNTSHYSTYAWIPEATSGKKSAYDNDIAADKIVDAASAEMNKRGFKLDNAQPDLLIRYTADVNKENVTYNDPVYYNPPARLMPRVSYYRGRAVYYYSYTNPLPVYVGNRARHMQIKEGSIVIDIVERKTSKLIWRGWAEGEIDNPQKAVEDIPAVVANIFKKLP